MALPTRAQEAQELYYRVMMRELTGNDEPLRNVGVSDDMRVHCCLACVCVSCQCVRAHAL
jgi:hypothetical protein